MLVLCVTLACMPACDDYRRGLMDVGRSLKDVRQGSMISGPIVCMC